jgi:hypothetical protein
MINIIINILYFHKSFNFFINFSDVTSLSQMWLRHSYKGHAIIVLLVIVIFCSYGGPSDILFLLSIIAESTFGFIH